MRWDIFCKVIDNHGDTGVCWRLACGLAAAGDTARLWIDDGSALAWMAPQGCKGVEVHAWPEAAHAQPGDAIVEAFGCDPDPVFLVALADRTRRTGRQPPWINLEHLSAEGWVERCHRLPSPLQSGPAAGLTRHFFYPGFTPATGGLLREAGLLAERQAFDRQAWLREHGIPFGGERLISLFCYEPPGLQALLRQLAADPRPTRLLVTAGRATAALRALLASGLPTGPLAIDWLPLMPQPAFDRLLWSCDLNVVRGEDSIVRALWAGAPLVWHIYQQDDGAHGPKLQAFLDWLQAPASLRAAHAAWAGGGTPWPDLDLPAWGEAVMAARGRLLAQPDLVTQLRTFAAGLQAG